MFLPVALAIVVSLLLCRMTRRSRGTIGFLHPNSGGGGGGERVLWIAVKAFQDRDAAANTPRTYTIYTKPYPGLLQRVQEQFGITLDTARVEVKDLRFSHLTEPQYYPRFTLILQSVCGALAVFLEVVLRHRPTEVVIDTVGNAFAYPLFAWLCGCRVGTYTHYPTVSSDMLQNVRSGRAATNNSGRVAGSKVLSAIKVYYYRLFALAYGWAGRRAVVVTTNSTWTNNHIREVWRTDATTIVYPPVNATRLSTLGLAGRAGNTVVSVGQFRPEKDHELQIRAFYRAMRSGKCPSDARLLLVGGCRNKGDEERIAGLRALVARLDGAEAFVAFQVNAPFEELVAALGSAKVGLHAMRQEHFGICVVEYMAAGCVPVAHNSGGVKADIVRPGVDGFLAETEEEFADAIVQALTLSRLAYAAMQQAGRERCFQFSDEVFSAAICRAFASVLT
jgi:alpha-1,2-mannosyltransferase